MFEETYKECLQEQQRTTHVLRSRVGSNYVVAYLPVCDCGGLPSSMWGPIPTTYRSKQCSGLPNPPMWVHATNNVMHWAVYVPRLIWRGSRNTNTNINTNKNKDTNTSTFSDQQAAFKAVHLCLLLPLSLFGQEARIQIEIQLEVKIQIHFETEKRPSNVMHLWCFSPYLSRKLQCSVWGMRSSQAEYFHLLWQLHQNLAAHLTQSGKKLYL